MGSQLLSSREERSSLTGPSLTVSQTLSCLEIGRDGHLSETTLGPFPGAFWKVGSPPLRTRKQPDPLPKV